MWQYYLSAVFRHVLLMMSTCTKPPNACCMRTWCQHCGGGTLHLGLFMSLAFYVPSSAMAVGQMSLFLHFRIVL